MTSGNGKELAISTLVAKKQQQWKELSAFLSQWFHKPDLEALKITLSTYAAHTYLSDDPVWLFVIGPSGSGKTSIAIRAITFLQNTYRVSDLTTKTFSSGYGKDSGILGMLKSKHNGNGVLYFPDFTTIISKKEDEIKVIAGQMRAIYDGDYAGWKGNSDESEEWCGKVTCIAAATPVLEDKWSINNNLGERFIHVKWITADRKETARAAKGQDGNRPEMDETFKRLIHAYVDDDNLHAVKISKAVSDGIDGLADIISRLRTRVHRNTYGRKREISRIDEPEMPTRTAKSLLSIVKGSATLDRRGETDANDMQLAKRVALDSIPSLRFKVLFPLLDTLDYKATLEDVKSYSKLPLSPLKEVLEDLVALGIIDVYEGSSDKETVITPSLDIIESWEGSIIGAERVVMDAGSELVH